MEPMQLISLGAGVQSSVMAMMAARGELGPMPAGAVFADTQAEPASVYTWLDWLEKQLPFPIYRVTAGDLTQSALAIRTAKDGRKWTKTALPVYLGFDDGPVGKVPQRSCTADFKIVPIVKKFRQLAGIKRGQKTVGVIQWIGISLDEIQRMKPARDPWIESRWPLVERRMTRSMCLDWMERNGFPEPPRSACIYCPFHDAKQWRRLQVEEPQEFARAVQFEKDIQAAKSQVLMRGVPYLTRKCQPLETIDFRSDIERGQGVFDWSDECTGMCGV